MSGRRFHRKVRRIASVWVVCLPALLPVFEQHEARDAHGPTAPGLEIAVDAVHGSQPAHFEASRMRPHRPCVACLAAGSRQAMTVRPAAGNRLLAVNRSVIEPAVPHDETPLYATSPSRAPPQLL